MMKRLLATILFLIPNVAWATCSSVPYTFTPNTLAQSGQVNANFAALVSCANNIDTGQITTGVLPVARGGTNNGSWTTGSIVFATASTQLGQDNANLFWDSTNKRLMIGDSSIVGAVAPSVQFTLTGSNTSIAAAYSSSQASFALNPLSNGSWTMYDHVGGGFSASITSSGGNIGIGTVSPLAKLDIGGLTGSAASSIFRTNAGALGTTATNGLNLASIGFTATNQTSLGVHATRLSNGTDWTTTAIFMSMDVDGTIGDGGTVTLSHNGAVGVNTTNPTYTLDVSGDINSTGTYRIGGSALANSTTVTAGSTFAFSDGNIMHDIGGGIFDFVQASSSGGLIEAGNYSATTIITLGSGTACWVSSAYITGVNGLTLCASDARLKDIAGPVPDGATALVNQLKPVSYTWKTGVGGHPTPDAVAHTGFVAQDIQPVMPQCVNTNPDNFYSLDTNCLVAYMAKAIQEMNAKLVAHGIN